MAKNHKMDYADIVNPTLCETHGDEYATWCDCTKGAEYCQKCTGHDCTRGNNLCNWGPY